MFCYDITQGISSEFLSIHCYICFLYMDECLFPCVWKVVCFIFTEKNFCIFSIIFLLYGHNLKIWSSHMSQRLVFFNLKNNQNWSCVLTQENPYYSLFYSQWFVLSLRIYFCTAEVTRLCVILWLFLEYSF